MELLENKNKWFEKILIVVALSVIAYMIVYPILYNSTIIRLIWIPALALIMLSWFMCKTSKKLDIKWYFGIIALVFILLVGLLSSKNPAEIEKLFACVAFLTFMISLRIYSDIKISKRLFDIIYYMAVILTLLFFAYSFTDIAHKAFLDGEVTVNRYFVFNLDNSNIAGIYIYCFLCILLINLKVRKYKLINLGLIAIDFYLIYGTNSRASLLAAIVVFVLAMIPLIRKMPTVFVLLAWIFPIIFVSLYLYLYEAGYDDIEILNKSLFSGREVVYQAYLDRIENPLQMMFGNLEKAKLQNAHNAPLTYYTSMGFVGAVIAELMLITNILRINKPTKNSFVSVAAIMGLLVHSSFESSMLLGGYPAIVFVLIFFLLANYEGNPTKR